MLFYIILALSMQLSDSYTAQPPCCRDHIGTITCNRLAKTNSRMFTRRCNTDAEFRLIQCCSACNHSSETIAYDLIARSLVSEQCYDRYGSKFCARVCERHRCVRISTEMEL
ncbi:hypothetical protein V3C99_004225 [Haemonchus contortus]